MPKYLKWEKEDAVWHGVDVAGRRRFTVFRGVRGGKITTYLRRHNDALEVCATIGHAKEYADELARLAGYRPLTK